MKRVLIVLLVLALALPLAGLANEPAAFTAGSYEASAQGFGGELTVQVTVDDKSILAVEVKEHGETPVISDPAFDSLPALIVEKQTVALDAVAGCTMSSQAILEAAKAALLLAGASEESITKAPDAGDEQAAALEEKTADVIVIGAGGAGLTAAVEVLRAKGTVLVVDKMPNYGGNTIAAGSALNAAYTDIQKAGTMAASGVEAVKAMLALPAHDDFMARWQASVQADLDLYLKEGRSNVFDSPDLHKLQTYVGGDYVADPVLLDAFSKGAVGSVGYLEELGTVWRDSVDAAIGATWNRSHTPDVTFWGPKGASFVLPQTEKIKTQFKVEPLFEHKAEHILMTNGRASGVAGTTLSGQPFEATANKAVIIATGGFGANVEMRQRYNKHWADLGENIMTTNVKSATGDGIVMAEEVGAGLVGMEWIQMLLYPLNRGSMSASINNLVFVNTNGERFVREDGRRDVISGEVLKQPNALVWELFDQHEVDRMSGRSTSGKLVTDMVKDGNLVEGSSVADLAAKLEMDPAVLQKTLDEYNQAVDSKHDPLGRQVFGARLDQAPFYAFNATAMVHHTMGGIRINDKAQVLSTTGEVIPGLFAAGEVTGGIHGGNRLGGNAIADIITFGRIAGEEAMR